MIVLINHFQGISWLKMLLGPWLLCHWYILMNRGDLSMTDIMRRQTCMYIPPCTSISNDFDSKNALWGPSSIISTSLPDVLPSCIALQWEFTPLCTYSHNISIAYSSFIIALHMYLISFFSFQTSTEFFILISTNSMECQLSNIIANIYIPDLACLYWFSNIQWAQITDILQIL